MNAENQRRLAELEAKAPEPEGPTIRKVWDAINEIDGSEARQTSHKLGYAQESDPALVEVEEISLELAVLEYNANPDDQERIQELQQHASALLIDAFERHGKADLVAWMRSPDPTTGF